MKLPNSNETALGCEAFGNEDLFPVEYIWLIYGQY